MVNPGKMTTAELEEELISADNAITTVQEAILKELIEVKLDLYTGRTTNARNRIDRLVDELDEDIKISTKKELSYKNLTVLR